MKPHLEQRNELIRKRYEELFPKIGKAQKVYEMLWGEFKLRPNSIHQIVHHIEWYDKRPRS